MLKVSAIHFWDKTSDQLASTGISIGRFFKAYLNLASKRLRIASRKFGRTASHAPSHDETRDASCRLERLEAGIAFRQLLLEEIIHRTNNTLRIAIATLEEQISAVENAQTRRRFRSVQQELRTLWRVHNRYYGPTHSDIQSLSLRLSEICSSTFHSFGDQRSRIALSISAADVLLQRHQEISLSLILQELLMNTLSHAFPCERRRAVMVDFRVDDRSICHLTVRDNGVQRCLSGQNSTSLALVRGFAAGLQGWLVLRSSFGVTTARVSFPLSGI
jgi:two-component sensor histidine kinase